MTDLYDAAEQGNLKRVTLLVEQGVDKNQTGGCERETALFIAAWNNYLPVVRYLVEQGADMETPNINGDTPLICVSNRGCPEVVRYLLEQGADRDKTATSSDGWTSLHCAAYNDDLETAKLLMVYGADLNATNNSGEMPIDMARTEEMKQAIRDEPRRRMDHGHKRATEQDRHPNAATSASTQQDDEEIEEEQYNKKPRLDEGEEAEVGEIAEEDEDSEPSDEEGGN